MFVEQCWTSRLGTRSGEPLPAQGYAMGAPSIIEAGAECVDGQITKTFIRGSATIVRTEKISYTSR
jgi:hypothetical protein